MSSSTLAGVPLGLQTVVQGAIGGSERGFLVGRRGGLLVASGGGIASTFDRSGVGVTVAGGTVDFRLVGVGYGGRLAVPTGAVPVAAGNVARYRRGGIVEWYRNGPLGLEQGFTLNSRPDTGVGPLTLALSVGGSLRPLQAGGGVVFVSAAGAVRLRYAGLNVLDATGRRLQAALGVSGRRLLLRAWDQGAPYPLRIDPFLQQGPKLTGSGEVGPAWFGLSVALSADGNTALVGGPQDDSGQNGPAGAAWVFTRSGSTWSQQGPKLTPTGQADQGVLGVVEDWFGYSVALSADGNTALIGGPDDPDFVGAAWVFTRSGSTWGQQGPALTPGFAAPPNPDIISDFGQSVALSGDGNTALIGDPGYGGAWVFTRSGSAWSQQGPVLTGSGEVGNSQFGYSVALSADGESALIGGPFDNNGHRSAIGAAWVFTHVPTRASTRARTPWAQQGPKLTGSGEVGNGEFGSSVALSADGNTALVGGNFDNRLGAAWVFTRSGSRSGPSAWAQQGPKLTGNAKSGLFGSDVALSADGDAALIGDPGNSGAWLFTRSASTWAPQGPMLTGRDEVGSELGENFGESVSLAADGTALIGGPSDNGSRGAAWVFVATCKALQQVCAHIPAPTPVLGLTPTTTTTLPRAHPPTK